MAENYDEKNKLSGIHPAVFIVAMFGIMIILILGLLQLG